MLNATIKADLYAAYLAGGVEAAAEVAKANGLTIPTGSELSDLELELVAGGKRGNNGQGGWNRGANRRR